MSGRTIAIHHVNAALRGARASGLDVEPVLRAAGIPPRLCEEERARVTPDQFTRLIQGLWLAMDDELMGFGPQPSRRGTFAMMCHATIGCRSLGHALRRGTAFYALFPGAPRVAIDRGDGRAAMSFALPGFDDPDHFLTESLLVIWHRYSSWAIGRRIPLDGLDLAYPAPSHAAEYDLMFGCPLRFGAPTTVLTFAERYLDYPLLQDEASLRVFLRDSPADLLGRRDYDSSVGEQVRRMLTHGTTTLDAAAARLAVSPQTLRRRLAAEGTSFRALKDQLRRDAAIEALSRGDESIEDLGRRLGFSEASAFHRAFRRWTGDSPGSYRGR
ncbi:AraC family transcriptional regulator [Stackebrandtia nassauensis]|uniref:Transcriptional regulator, AraC family n=1 Tax=Stackebrandtia nassauensis (strain DSM 44728 / CIP 108903 / NRRL B-16338 / NBRC 102104 / LLR-40K-21) TaxID=446470 RepID=D3PYW9_STANL|nr:AraC family transcriptional regulator [Stackebrandtia nassauensis]ADD43552.1 transcriptional regulator, AraC family [Stackebrandtia nassauensis DSM 44728]